MPIIKSNEDKYYRSAGTVYIRECGGILYLGMAKEFRIDRSYVITRIMAKVATNSSMQVEWYCLVVHKNTREHTFRVHRSWEINIEKV